MKVRHIINMLQKVDPEANVFIRSGGPEPGDERTVYGVLYNGGLVQPDPELWDEIPWLSTHREVGTADNDVLIEPL